MVGSGVIPRSDDLVGDPPARRGFDSPVGLVAVRDPIGPFRGREAIGAAYRLQPPDDEVVLLGVEDDGHGGASG